MPKLFPPFHYSVIPMALRSCFLYINLFVSDCIACIMADFINDELEGVKIGYKKIDGTELVSCVPALVQFRMM